MNVFSKSRVARVAVCAVVMLWMAVCGFAAAPAPQASHGPSFPPDPWCGKVAHGPSFPPDPWDGKVAHGPSFPPDPWCGKA
jgi:hypothetical protein